MTIHGADHVLAQCRQQLCDARRSLRTDLILQNRDADYVLTSDLAARWSHAQTLKRLRQILRTLEAIPSCRTSAELTHTVGAVLQIIDAPHAGRETRPRTRTIDHETPRALVDGLRAILCAARDRGEL